MSQEIEQEDRKRADYEETLEGVTTPSIQICDPLISPAEALEAEICESLLSRVE